MGRSRLFFSGLGYLKGSLVAVYFLHHTRPRYRIYKISRKQLFACKQRSVSGSEAAEGKLLLLVGGSWVGLGLLFCVCVVLFCFFSSHVPLTQGRRNVLNLALPLLVMHQLSAKKYQE